MDRKLFLLGLLRQHEMYGYQINELIDAHLGTSLDLTKPTAYRLLHEMEEAGWVTCQMKKVGKRPTRQIYAITPAGEIEFKRILRDSLDQYHPVNLTSSLSLAFMHELPSEEVVSRLESRQVQIEKLLSARESPESHHGAFRLLIDHQIRHLQTDLALTKEMIARQE
jgi:DNA-binding PadR family transcriptional regulator